MQSNPFQTIEHRLDRIESILSEPKERPKEWGGVELAAELTGKSKQTIYGLIYRKKIPHYKQAGSIYFKRSELISWIESGKGDCDE